MQRPSNGPLEPVLALEDRGGAQAFYYGDRDDAAARRLDELGTGDLVHRVIASFDQHVRLKLSDQLFGCRLVENCDDAGQAGQQAGAVFLIDHRQGSPV